MHALDILYIVWSRVCAVFSSPVSSSSAPHFSPGSGLRLRPATVASELFQLLVSSKQGNNFRFALDGTGIFITLKLALWSKIPYAEL
ncbi:hypothetical protein V6N13_021576 [Hibiscus sabdariffa]|uniref:Secreted protein n=2 Tax=Hibiscus sabdariffa TaxID=183260 RepID=A0ABR2B9K6_9ROSI